MGEECGGQGMGNIMGLSVEQVIDAACYHKDSPIKSPCMYVWTNKLQWLFDESHAIANMLVVAVAVVDESLQNGSRSYGLLVIVPP